MLCLSGFELNSRWVPLMHGSDAWVYKTKEIELSLSFNSFFVI